jgi:peptide/nickel transport system substrate-binding protein
MTERPAKFRAAIFFVAVALLASACSISSPEEPSRSSGADSTLTVAVDSVLSEDLDPILNQANAQAIYYSLLYDGLIELDPATGKPTPGLAESWSSDPAGKVWTFKLRSGVTFSDGSPLTAEDVKFSIERYAKQSKGPGASRMAEYLDRVDAVDPQTVRVVTKTSAPVLLTDLTTVVGAAAAYIVPKAYVEKVGDAGFDKKPIGSGPFTFVSQDPGRSMKFAANAKYWGDPKPSVRDLDLRIVPDTSARLAMLRTGEADIATGITGPAVQTVVTGKDYQTKIAEDSELTSIQIGGQNNPSSPLSHVEVRKAISVAIDRDQIVKTLLNGQGSPAYLFGFPFGTGFPADAEKYKDSYDPTEAKRLLAQAGFAKGFPLQIYAATEGRDFADAIVQNLEAVGIDATSQIVDQSALLDEFQSPQGKKKDRLVLVFGPSGHGARPDFTQLLQAHLDPASSFAQISDKSYLPLLNSAITDPNDASRAAAIGKVVTTVFDRETVLAAWYINTIFATGKDVESWTPIKGVAFPQNLQSVRLAR